MTELFLPTYVRYKATDPGSSEYTKQDQCPKPYTQAYHIQTAEDQKKEIDESAILVFNTPLSEMDRFSRLKISKDTAELHSTKRPILKGNERRNRAGATL